MNVENPKTVNLLKRNTGLHYIGNPRQKKNFVCMKKRINLSLYKSLLNHPRYEQS